MARLIMNATTRWNLNESNNSFEEIIKLIKDGCNDSDTIYGIQVHPFNENFKNGSQSISLNKNEIHFYVVKVNYMLVQTDSPTKKQNIIIFYKLNDDSIKIIIDKNSGAQRLLRLILGFSGKDELSSVSSHISNQLIIWIIESIYDNNPIDDDQVLGLESVSGINGKSTDLDNTVNIRGDRTMNLLSSLSFLLESNQLNRVIVENSFDNHKLIVDLSTRQTIKIKDYMGPFNHSDSVEKYGEDSYEFLPYILLYCDILPKLIDLYNNVGNHSDYKFLESLAEDIRIKIDNRLKEIKN